MNLHKRDLVLSSRQVITPNLFDHTFRAVLDKGFQHLWIHGRLQRQQHITVEHKIQEDIRPCVWQCVNIVVAAAEPDDLMGHGA